MSDLLGLTITGLGDSFFSHTGSSNCYAALMRAAYWSGPDKRERSCRPQRISFVPIIVACYASDMPRRTEPEPFAAKVGARVRELRLERNMSMSDLANTGGLSKGHLSAIEHGLAAITVQTIDRLAKAFGLPALYVLTFAADDVRAHAAELVRKLPMAEIKKLRRELTKATQAAARAQSVRTRSLG